MMAERLRSRDPRSNTNKCYSIFFDDDLENPTTTTITPTATIMKTRSPPKKRNTSSPAPKMKSSSSVTSSVLSLPSSSSSLLAMSSSTDDIIDVGQEISSGVKINNDKRSSVGKFTKIVQFKDDDKNQENLSDIKKDTSTIDNDDDDDDDDGERKKIDNKHVAPVKSESCESCNILDVAASLDVVVCESNNKRKFSDTLENTDDGISTIMDDEISSTKIDNNNDNDLMKKIKLNSEKDQMFELFQPWALKTYGDQAKTKTITFKKKSRILKALDGKEQNNPDSSKFRFWVKSKGFTIQKPENFIDNRIFSNNQESQKDYIDLYVTSMAKDFSGKTYRKVAVVEEFFDIIYNVHVESGGRGGRHAGQKRTYRIITETYAFLPREAVTKFLTGCPVCKKNLRPFSPSRFDEQFTESSSEFEILNYSSQNESSIDSTQLDMITKTHQQQENLTKDDNLMNNIMLKNIKGNSTTSNSQYKENLKNNENIDLLEISSNNDRTEKNNEKISYFHEITEKITKNFYKNENCDETIFNINDFKTDTNNVFNYYQFLKKFSRHSTYMNCNKTSTITAGRNGIGSTTIKKSIIKPILINCDNKNLMENLKNQQNFNLNKLDNNNLLINDKKDINLTMKKFNSSENNININNNVFNDVSINMINNKKNEKKLTTPPKKRYNRIETIQNESKELLTNQNNQLQLCAINNNEITNNINSTDSKNQVFNDKSDFHQIQSFQLDLRKVKPITSTYLKMTRSFGLTDEDALKIDDLESAPTTTPETITDTNPDEAYAGLMKDADKLKLMLLAWNYQNSNAVRNGSEGPDLGVVGGLWAQYQNALALNAKQPSLSPVNRADQSSPIENQDETNSSGQKDEDDGSEDDSDDKLDQNAQDPERLKAFNMFVRLFVDENLDRMIPISKQPKEKIQAIIDSCARQFPEFCERSRKRIRTYLKSCRRNKKAREGWDNTSRPTPAHLTSVQAEQILAIACENESMNAKRMRIGLDPISQSMPLPNSTNVTTETIAPSISYPGFRTTPNTTVTTTEADGGSLLPSTTGTNQNVTSARNSPLSLNTTANEAKPLTGITNGTTNSQVASPLYRPADFTSPSSTSSPYPAVRPQTYPTFFQNSSTGNATPTDLSMKQTHSQQLQQQQQQQPMPLSSTNNPCPTSTARPPLLSHKLNPNEMNAVRQLITGYRESAAFLLRSADELEQLLLQQQ